MCLCCEAWDDGARREGKDCPRMLILLFLLGFVCGGWGDGEKLYLVYSSINSFTQNKVCGVYCVLRTDTPGQNIAGQRRDISNFFFMTLPSRGAAR